MLVGDTLYLAYIADAGRRDPVYGIIHCTLSEYNEAISCTVVMLTHPEAKPALAEAELPGLEAR